MIRAVLLALVASSAVGQHEGFLRSGPIPAALAAPVRAVWIARDEREPPVECFVPQPSAWACRFQSRLAAGLVVVIDAQQGVAAVPVGLSAPDSTPVTGLWGRAVHLIAGGVTVEDLHDLTVSAWRPVRPASRLLTQRFSVAEEPAVGILRIADDLFWITGTAADPDAYVRIDGPAVATSRLMVAALQDGQPEVPVFADLGPPDSLQGRVVDAHGGDVDNAIVDLWALLHPGDDSRAGKETGARVLRWSTVRSDAEGRFEFPRLGAGPYEVSAMHAVAGRGATPVSSLREPVVLMLTSPVVVTGRVLRQGLAIGAARVRFVPDRVAFAESADPAAHVGTEVATDPAGRFQLPLPPDPRGVVQVYALDGSAVRVPVRAAAGTGEVSLGDIQLPERRAATIRLMDPRSCDLSAVGPVGQLGLAVVRATRISAAIFQLLVPEAGTWLLDVQCGDRSYRAVPGAIVVPAAGADPLVDLRLEESEPFRR